MTKLLMTQPSAPPNPFGSCFDAAAHNFMANADIESLVVCHGLGTANRPEEVGKRISHAWLEYDHPEHGRIAFDPIWLVLKSFTKNHDCY